MRKLLLGLFLFSFSITGISQEANAPGRLQQKYFIDYAMGPYLLIHHIQYDALMVNGARLGFNFGASNRFNFTIEYLAGNNSDIYGKVGMTHNANLGVAMYLKENSKHFDPFCSVGTGFLEFKEFTNDNYGISWHVGFGSSLQVTKRFSGLLEARYFNTGLLDVDGYNQLVVLWGARFGF